MFNPLPVVLADMRRSKAGVLAIIALVAIAVALGVAISAQERALREGSADAADRFDILIGAPGSPTQLVLTSVYLQPAALELIDGSILNDLAADEGVVWASPLAFGDFHAGYPIIGVTADFPGSDLAEGSRLDGRLFEQIEEAVIGADVQLAIKETFAPAHGLLQINDPEIEVHEGFHFTVVGRLPRQGTPWDRAIMVPVEAVWQAHAMVPGRGGDAASDGGSLGPPWPEPVPGVPAIVAKPVSIGDAYRLRGLYRASDTMALFPAEVLVELYEVLGNARTVLAMIAVGTQALVIAAVLLAVFASLAQRRRQVALLRALGASRAYVFATVWCHVTIMIGTGAILGFGLGWLGAIVVSRIIEADTGMALPVTLGGQELAMVAALVGIGSMLALIPSVLSYRQSVSAGLRA